MYVCMHVCMYVCTGAVGLVDGSADVCDARTSSVRHATRKEAIRDLTLKRYLSIEANETNDEETTTTATSVAAPSFKMVMKKRKL